MSGPPRPAGPPAAAMVQRPPYLSGPLLDTLCSASRARGSEHTPSSRLRLGLCTSACALKPRYWPRQAWACGPPSGERSRRGRYHGSGRERRLRQHALRSPSCVTLAPTPWPPAQDASRERQEQFQQRLRHLRCGCCRLLRAAARPCSRRSRQGLPRERVWAPSIAAGDWAASGEIDIAELRNTMLQVRPLPHARQSRGACDPTASAWPCCASTPSAPLAPCLAQNIGSLHFGGQWNWSPANMLASWDTAHTAGVWHTYAVEWEQGRVRCACAHSLMAVPPAPLPRLSWRANPALLLAHPCRLLAVPAHRYAGSWMANPSSLPSAARARARHTPARRSGAARRPMPEQTRHSIR